MKKIILSFFFAFVLLFNISLASAENTFKKDARAADGFTYKTQEFQGNLQMLIDYDARTDGQPVYIGYAISGKGTSDDAWIIYNFQYNGSNFLTSKKAAYGVWDDRGSLTYQ